jgi:hypothetical protein
MSFERRRNDRDRRQARRKTAVFAVTSKVGHRLQLAQAEDIAPAGMTLRRPKDSVVLPDTSVALTFDLPGTNRRIAVAGEVVSDRRDGGFRRTGVRFTSLAADDALRIAQYCDSDDD